MPAQVRHLLKNCHYESKCADTECSFCHAPGTLLQTNKENRKNTPYYRFKSNYNDSIEALKIFHPIYGVVPLVLISLDQHKDWNDPQNIRNLTVHLKTNSKDTKVPIIAEGRQKGKEYSSLSEMKSAMSYSFKSHIVAMAAHFEGFVADLIKDKLNCMHNEWMFQRCNKNIQVEACNSNLFKHTWKQEMIKKYPGEIFFQ